MEKDKKSVAMVLLVFIVFFVISFITNVLGPIIPDIISSFHLSLGMAGFLPFAFFVAYAVMSIPAGILIEKYSEKPNLIGAFVLGLAGALLFALFPSYTVAVVSLFMIGIGMAVLQVAINPLLRVSGGEAHFAFYSAMAQLIFGLASFLSPLVYMYLVHRVHTGSTVLPVVLLDRLVPQKLEWVSLYWLFALIILLMIAFIAWLKFPKFELLEEEKIRIGPAFRELLANRYVILFFFGLFSYVGTEQGIANWISKFLQTYHQVDPSTLGARTVSWFWGMMTAGCFVGLGLLKVFDSKSVLLVFTAGAMIALAVALAGTREMALIAFPATGFFASVMYPVVFSLALNSVPRHHGTFSGILCTGIAGGAVISLLIGLLAEQLGLRYAMLILFLTLGYLFSIGIWARPIISNATVWSRLKDLLSGRK